MDFMSSEVRTSIIANLCGDRSKTCIRPPSSLYVMLPTGEGKSLKENLVFDEQISILEIHINKLGHYFEGGESNATLPIIVKRLAIKGIIDVGVRVSIITKHWWESMGRTLQRF